MEYQYDDENQLTDVIYVEKQIGLLADWLPLYRSQFIYDGKGRLRKIVEYEMGPENFDPQPNWLELGSTSFVYDGRRIIQERSAADSLNKEKSFFMRSETGL